MRSLLFSCLAYLALALPASALGVLWPSMEASFHAPVGALGILLLLGTAAEVLASAVAGRVLTRLTAGPVVAAGVTAVALALGAEALAPALLVLLAGSAVFGLGFGAVDTALNAHAARWLNARDITWIHASYGLGAALGPLLAAALLSDGLGWRAVYGAEAVTLAVFAAGFLLARRSWDSPPGTGVAAPRPDASPPSSGAVAGRRKRPAPVVLGTLIFAVVEAGIESGAGIWGYVFLTAGRGLSPAAAAGALSAYWAMMFAGRVVLGPVAQRAGASRVLGAAVAAVALGAALLTWPGTGPAAVTGLLVIGFAAAPVFPLLAITQARRAEAAGRAGAAAQAVGLQVAASAIGSSVLPAGLGLAVGAFQAGVLAPALLAMAVAMCCLYRLLSRLAGRS